MENRIVTLEAQLKDVIQNMGLSESSSFSVRPDHLESIPDEKESEFSSTISHNQLLKSCDLQDSCRFNTSKIFEQNNELQKKLEELLEKIIPEKDEKLHHCQLQLQKKNLLIKDLEHELDKAHHTLGDLKTNIQDLKQRAKVLEDYLREHTNKPCESFIDVSQLMARNANDYSGRDHFEVEVEEEGNEIFPNVVRNLNHSFITPNKEPQRDLYNPVFNAKSGQKTVRRGNPPKYDCSQKYESHTEHKSLTKDRNFYSTNPTSKENYRSEKNSKGSFTPLDISQISLKDTSYISMLANRAEQYCARDSERDEKEIYLRHYFRGAINEKDQELYEDSTMKNVINLPR